jgi:hypothetical protein
MAPRYLKGEAWKAGLLLPATDAEPHRYRNYSIPTSGYFIDKTGSALKGDF